MKLNLAVAIFLSNLNNFLFFYFSVRLLHEQHLYNYFASLIDLS